MAMNRRNFLRLAGAAGLAVATRPAVSLADGSDNGPWGGPLWVTLHAGGGWDPTLLCDPKGRLSATQTDPVNNSYRADQIVEVGGFRLAPVAGHVEVFTRWGSRLLALNGVDTGTNSHDTGTRHVWSGTFDLDAPSIAALTASTLPAVPPSLAFLSFGGYDATGQLVPPTRIPSADAIRELAFPELTDANNAATSVLIPENLAALREARLNRLGRQAGEATHPRRQRAMGVLMETLSADSDLIAITRHLPTTLDSSQNPLIRQAQICCAAFKAGLAVSASLTSGGFDTHGNHDAGHTPSMQRVVAGLDFLLQEAERQGIADRLFIVVGSDFGRTPGYNATNGKDHWPVTSMLVAGPGIRGGRTVGASDYYQAARNIDPVTLAPVESGGVRLTPGVIHRALRRHAGLEGTEVATRFRVVGDDLDLFS
jgi:hypothetical protein